MENQEGLMTVADVIELVSTILKDELIAQYNKETNKLHIRLLNGQSFCLTAVEE